jgi:DUF2075 family protein
MNDSLSGVLYTIHEFNELVEQDLDGLVGEICSNVTGRKPSPKEVEAMKSSYTEVSMVLAEAVKIKPSVASAYIGVPMVKFEYKLPSAPAWCDLVMLGVGKNRKQAVIVELKDWFKNASDRPGMCEGLMEHKGVSQEHPSDQVKGYVLYCSNFHSAVLESDAEVSGCVFFTRSFRIEPYCEWPNNNLTKEYPVFSRDNRASLASYVVDHIDEGDSDWAVRFINGYYQQNRNILKQVAEAFQANADARPFVLLGEQRKGYHHVLHRLSEAVQNASKKLVMVVSGPPGSGKSAIALNLWAEAVRRYVANVVGEHPGNVVFVSTSSSQDENWQSIFENYSEIDSSRGLVMRSNRFNPGMTGGTMKTKYLPIFRKKDAKYLRDEESLDFKYYEDYTNYMVENGLAEGYKDNLHFLSIVDEAHALINPLANGFNTNKMSGWCMQMGPQPYHIIRESQVSVFFMDGEQSFRDNETTTLDDIKQLAEKLGATCEVIDLSDLQFRCAGSVEYVDWVEGLFTKHPATNVDLWKDQFVVKVFDTTHEMEKDLRAEHKNGRTVRLLSSYTVPWISSKKLDEMHTGGQDACDFDFKNEDGTVFRRHWNNPKRMDIFVQAPPHTMMHEDPLCEVGCPYEIRGFDFDFVGLLWLDDIVWRKDRWMVDLSKTLDRANTCSYAQARNEQIEIRRGKGFRGNAAKTIPLVPLDAEGMPMTKKFFRRIIQSYRILLTRAVQGVFIYIHDQETRAHVRHLLGQ